MSPILRKSDTAPPRDRSRRTQRQPEHTEALTASATAGRFGPAVFTLLGLSWMLGPSLLLLQIPPAEHLHPRLGLSHSAAVAVRDRKSSDPATPVATDEAATAGIAETTLTYSADVGDYDGDGWSDVLLGRHYAAPARLYRNTGGQFVEVVPGTFVRRDRHDCDWADVDGDGRVDVYCTRGAGRGTLVKKNDLWMQHPGGGFVNRGEEYGVTDPYGRARSTTFLDADGDGRPDLFVGNFFPRQDTLPSPNRLFLNVGGTSFRSAPEYGLDVELGGECAQAADYDGDGRRDLLVCGKTSLRFFRNDAGTRFLDVTRAVGISGFWTDAKLVDLDGDGRLDLAQVRRNVFQVRLQRDGVFGAPTGVRPLVAGWKLATGDVNRDLRPDVYVLQTGDANASNHPDVMLLNRGGGTFDEIAIPETSLGVGDKVSPIDYDRDGRTDFIVLNGYRTTPGPIQLIHFAAPTAASPPSGPTSVASLPHRPRVAGVLEVLASHGGATHPCAQEIGG